MIIKRGTLVKIKDKDYVYDNYPEFYHKTQTYGLNKYTYLTGSNPQNIDETFKVLERKKDYDGEEICVIKDIKEDTEQVYLVGISGLEREDKVPVKMTNEEQEEITTLNSDVFIEEITNKVNKNLSKSLEMINNTLSKKSEFESKMIDGIVAKGKEIAVEDLKDELKKDLDNFIEERYGVLPKVIQIKDEENTKEMKGMFHYQFEDILKMVKKDIPLMLTGPAGAGKNHTLEQVAEALDLDFYFTNSVTQEYKLTGFIDANGKYHETEFFKAFTNGGLFFLDEVDASVPEALIILNSAIANRYFDFPIGRIKANENFRVVCAGNTYGTGADMIYVGRNVLDGATLDRFVVVKFTYDNEIEKQLAYDKELYDFIHELRRVVNSCSLRYIVSMRAIINATKLLEIGQDKKTILKTAIIKNMQIDDLNTIINKFNLTDNEWYQELKKMTGAR